MAVAGLLVRARLVVLSFLALLTVGAIARSPHIGLDVSALAVAETVVSISLLAAGAFFLLRHAGLALAVVLAPLPGLLIAAFVTWSYLPSLFDWQAAMMCWTPGFAATCLIGWRIAAKVAGGTAPRDVVIAAIGELLPMLGAAFVLVLGVQAAIFFLLLRGAVEIILIAGAYLSAILAAPLVISFLSFNEDFVARFNRAAEQRRRRLMRLDPLVQPRWAWSLCGVALVLTVLSCFGIQGSHDLASTWLAVPAVLIAATLAALRDWRYALAALLTFAVAALLFFWLGVDHGSLSAASIVAVAIYALSWRTAAFERQGDDTGTAILRTFEDSGTPVVYALWIAGIAILPFANRASGVFFATLIVGAAAALVFPPAFAVAIESLIPRRATIEARYRVR
jgi:hypothetical protein